MTVEAPPRPPDHDDLQALIEEARRRARRRRRRTGAVAAVMLLIAAGAYLLVLLTGGTATPASPAPPRSGGASLRVGAGPFWYMRTIGTMRAPRCAQPLPGVMHRCGATVWFDVVMSSETWVGVDGTMRERTVEVSQRFASPAGRARWLASGRRIPVPVSIAQGDALDIASGHFPSAQLEPIAPQAPPAEGPPMGAGPLDVGDGPFTYRQLVALPVDGVAALMRIRQAEAALRHRYGRMLLRWHSPGARLVAHADLAPAVKAGRSIQELTLMAGLDAAPVPPRVRLALFHAATDLPGATVTRRRDEGVTVSTSYPHWQTVGYTFDPHSGRLLTGLPVDGGYPDVPGPASTVVAQGPVDSITALPAGVTPIRGVGAPPLWPSPPAPTIEAVQPSVGQPRTVFTIRLAGVPSQRAANAPTAWFGITGSAGYGIYRGPDHAFDPCLPQRSVRVWPTTTIRGAGGAIYVYRIGPQRFHLRAWCPGRYSVGFDALPNPLPARYTTPPYTGPSGTSTYINVRWPRRSAPSERRLRRR